MEDTHYNQRYWIIKDLMLLLCILVAINFTKHLRAFCADDLWGLTYYHDHTFWEFVLNTVADKFRPVSNVFVWIGLRLTGGGGDSVTLYTLLFTYLAGITVYAAAKEIGKSRCLGLLAGILFLTSRFSYYCVYQFWGVMESCSLALSVLCLLFMYRYIRYDTGKRMNFAIAALFSLLTTYSHERFMCLYAVLFLMVLMKLPEGKLERAVMLGTPVAMLVGTLALRNALFSVPFSGTGGTDMLSTLNISQILWFFFVGVAAFFGVNLGEEYLFGMTLTQMLRTAPFFAFLAAVFTISVLILVVLALRRVVTLSDTKEKNTSLKIMVVIFAFICGTLAFSCTTIRLEMRWLYAPYAGCLLLLAFCVQVLLREDALPADGGNTGQRVIAALLAVMMLSAVPLDVFYHKYTNRIYYFGDMYAYNDLYALGIEKYGRGLYTAPIVLLEPTTDAFGGEMTQNFFLQYERELYRGEEDSMPPIAYFYVKNLEDAPYEVWVQGCHVLEVGFDQNGRFCAADITDAVMPVMKKIHAKEHVGTTIREAVFEEGFYGWEGGGQAYVHMPTSGTMVIRTGTQHTMSINAATYEYELPNRLRVYFDNNLICEQTLTETNVSFTVESENIPVDTAGELRLEMDFAKSPTEAGTGADIRRIGLTINDLEFQ